MTNLIFIKSILVLILLVACGLCGEEIISRELKKKCFDKKETPKNRIAEGNKNDFKGKEGRVETDGDGRELENDSIRLSEDSDSDEGDAHFLLGRRKSGFPGGSGGRKNGGPSSSWSKPSTFFNGRNKGVNKQRKGSTSSTQSSTRLPSTPPKGYISLNSQGESTGKEGGDRTRLGNIGGENGGGIRRPLLGNPESSNSKTNTNGTDSIFPSVEEETEPPEYSPDTIDNEEEENSSKKSIEEKNKKDEDTIISGIETSQSKNTTSEDFYPSNSFNVKGNQLQQKKEGSWPKKQKWPLTATGRDFDTLLEVNRVPIPKNVSDNMNERRIEGGVAERVETKEESKGGSTPSTIFNPNQHIRSEGERKILTSGTVGGGGYPRSPSPTHEMPIGGESRKGTTQVIPIRSFSRRKEYLDLENHDEGELDNNPPSIKTREKRKSFRCSNRKNTKKRKKRRKRREGWKKKHV